MISRREMLRTSGAVLAGLAALRGGWRSVFSRGTSQQEDDLAQYVDPFIGTAAHGHTYPGAQTPFGMVQLSPDNGVHGWDWSSGYHWSSERIAGFSHTHLSGTGIGDMYDILFMPTFTSRPPLASVSSRFSHEAEQAEPGYYSVLLLDSGVRAELTATDRVGVHRYEFPLAPQGRQPSIAVDLGHSLNWDRPTDTAITVDGPTSISGRRLSTGWAKDQHVYFAAGFSRPFDAHWLESEWASPGTHRELAGERVRGVFQFLMRPGQRIVAKVAISPVSVEAAKRNLRQEVPGWDFDAVRRAARLAWNRALSRVRLEAASREERVVLYTALYHAFLAPQIFCDVDGAYRGPDGATHQARGFYNYSVFSLWDTFRAEHPLLTLVQPERVHDLVESMMAFYREGGLLPVWSLAGSETDTMIGYHSLPVILDAWQKRLTSVDPREALDAMTASALQDAHGLRFYKVPAPEPLQALARREARSNLRRTGQVGPEELARHGALVSGYGKTLGGDTLIYHSPYPGARSALLIRTEEGTKTIAWETALVPAELAGRRISFIWLAGLDAGSGRRRFELHVNGRRWFGFRGPRITDKGFRASGPAGSRLTFTATHADQHDDLFGFMFLTLPAGLAPGARLELEVKAEAAGTRDWYMTFEHPVTERVIADNAFGFVRQGSDRRQVARIDVEHLGPPTEATIRVADEQSIATRLEFGHNRVVAPAPLVEAQTTVTIHVSSDGRERTTHLRLRPVRPFGYVPADLEPESVSKTLEYAYDDWCIARMAEALGEHDEARLFFDRATSYGNLFDPATGFMRGRRADGGWKEPFSPRAASHRQDEYTEGNAWQYSWFVPHDVQGLIDLMGGREAFVAKLDELFEQTSELEGSAPPDITGMIGQYAHGNEPGHHIAYLYAYAGAPWKTQERVRQITGRLYGPGADGLPGNEDCGQMSAWFILSAIGFYPVNPAEGIYVLGTPHYERVSIELGEGKTFTVEAPGVSKANMYVQSVRLNGRPLSRVYITHAEIVAGGVLSFTMADRPNRTWGAEESAAPPSMSRP